jgi:hypothetical protein
VKKLLNTGYVLILTTRWRTPYKGVRGFVPTAGISPQCNAPTYCTSNLSNHVSIGFHLIDGHIYIYWYRENDCPSALQDVSILVKDATDSNGYNGGEFFNRTMRNTVECKGRIG